MDNILEKDIHTLQVQEEYRFLRTLTSPQGRRIEVDGKEMLNFSSNDYLGLSGDPRICQQMMSAIQQWGVGSGASRLICGNFKAHEELEQTIAKMKKTQRAIVFSSGYTANLGVISALMDHRDIVFSDRLNHASIVDAITLSRAKMCRYAHCDMEKLEFFLQKHQNFRRKLIVTDTVFSMDGDQAPLEAIVKLAKKYQAWVMVDEAHAFGVLGNKGMGLVELLGLQKEIDIQMGTLSKAVGLMGGYVAGSQVLCDYLINKSRSFIFTTAQPPCLVSAIQQSLELIQAESWRREKLFSGLQYFQDQVRNMGLDIAFHSTPIVPIRLKDNQVALKWSQKLAQQGIFVPAIRPPSVPQGQSRLRVTFTASHTKQDIDVLVQGLKQCLRGL